MFIIGRINSTFGLKGELKLINKSDFDRFYKGAKVYLKDNTLLVVENVRQGKKGLIIKFVGIDNIDDAYKIANNDLYTDQKPQLKEDEYTYQSLIGLDVYNQNNQFLGKVVDVIFYPSQQLLRVKKENTEKTILIPFLKQFIKEVSDTKIDVLTIEGME